MNLFNGAERTLFALEREGSGNTPVPHIPFMPNRARPGWAYRPYRLRRTLTTRGTAQKGGIVCHAFYAKGHIVPSGALPVRPMQKIFEKCENLTEGEKSWVSEASCQRARIVLTPQQGTQPPIKPRRTEPLKKKAIRGSRYGDLHYFHALRQPSARNVCMEETSSERSG